jgi:hypothetical protein
MEAEARKRGRTLEALLGCHPRHHPSRRKEMMSDAGLGNAAHWTEGRRGEEMKVNLWQLAILGVTISSLGA